MRFLKRVTAMLLAIVLLGTTAPVLASLTAETSESSIPGWTFVSSYSDSGMYLDTSEGVRGKASLKLVNRTVNTSTKTFGRLDTHVTVQKGKTYQFEFEAKAKNANNVTTFFNWGTRSSLTPSTKTYDWMSYKFSYRPTADETTAIRFVLDDKTDGLWLDNLRFYDVTKPSVNLIENGDFENCSGPTEPSDSSLGEDAVSEGSMSARYGTMIIDGKLDDWKDIPARPITRRQNFAQVINVGDAADITADIRFAFDDENLYVAMTSNDAVHVITDTSKYWEGDGVQFAVADSRLAAPVLVERGMSYNAETGEVFQNKTDFSAAASREGMQTIYEIALPWNNDFGTKIPDEILFNALVNQNDGNGRTYCLEISPGISMNKDVKSFYTLALQDRPVGNVLYTLSCLEEIPSGNRGTATIKINNGSDAAQSVTVTVEEIGFTQKITVPAKAVRNVSVDFKIEDETEHNLTFRVTNDGKEDVVQKTVKRAINYKDTYPEFRKKIEGYIAELKELLLACENKGLSPDYEIASYSIICKYLEYADILAKKDDYSLFSEFDRVFTREYEKTRDALTAYLKGEKMPLTAPKYLIDGKIQLDGTSVIAKTTHNGVIEERPVFFVGYGPWETAAEEMPFFGTVGYNSLQTEISMENVFVTFSLKDWGYYTVRKPQVTIDLSKEDSVSGEYSLKLTNPAGYTHNVFSYLSQSVKVEPDTTYTYGVKAKAKGLTKDSAWFNIHGRASTGRQKLSDSDDWKEYVFEYTTGSNETTLDFTILFEDKIEYLYIDDCFIIKQGTKENVLKNGKFDSDSNSQLSKFDKEAMEMGVYINYAKIDWLRDILDLAQQNNFLVDLNLCPHYMPSFIKERDPEITSNKLQFLPFTLDHETVRKTISLWSRLIASVASEYDCVQSICITNEPSVRTKDGTHYLPLWHEFLKERYQGDISRLNENHGTNYQNFDEVPLPSNNKEATPSYYDYRCFNDWVSTDFHKFIAEEIRKENPDILLHAKVMDYFHYKSDSKFYNGANYETISEYLDLNGSDAFAFYNNASYSLPAKMSWYDFQTSVLDAPAWDTESHISQDKANVGYDNLVEYYTGADVWNGGVHGRGTSVIWLWDLQDKSMPWGGTTYPNANAAVRPADAVEVSRAALDLNRLAKEVTAIQKAERMVGVLYSRTSQGYVTDIMTSTIKAYEDAIFSGQKVGFITETKPETMHDYKLVVIPETPNVPVNVVNHLKTYIENGGQVLITNKDALKLNEYNQPHDSETIAYIYEHAIVEGNLRDKIEEMGLSKVVLVDAETGAAIDNVEWSYAEFDGNIVVNVVNYDKEKDITIKVKYTGNETHFDELRSMESGISQLTLKPYRPVLLSFVK